MGRRGGGNSRRQARLNGRRGRNTGLFIYTVPSPCPHLGVGKGNPGYLNTKDKKTLIRKTGNWQKRVLICQTGVFS